MQISLDWNLLAVTIVIYLNLDESMLEYVGLSKAASTRFTGGGGHSFCQSQ